MDGYVRDAVKSELNRHSPAPRTANVVSIHDRYCMVTYTGESTVVKIPYNNLAPSYEGQVVLIDGPAGDRRIVEVMGRTSIESRIDEVENFRFTPPLWYPAMMEYPETYPLLMTNNSRMMEAGRTFVTPMIAPRTTDIVRLEMRLVAARPNSTVKISLYKVSGDFILTHVQSVTLNAGDTRPALNLSTPLHVEPGDILAAGASATFSNSDNRPDFSAVLHPPLNLPRENQFAIARFNSNLQESVINPDPAIVDTWDDMHMWAAAMDYIPS